MNVRKQTSNLYIAAGALVTLILILIPFPQTSNLAGLVSPISEFVIASNGNGQYTTLLQDHWHNRLLEADHLVTERDGIVHFSMPRNLPHLNTVMRGDTLATLSASKLEAEIIRLKGNLNLLRANLKYERSGSRETEIEAARQQLAFARTRYEEQQKILKRSQDLFIRQIISQQEYDIDLRRERLDSIRVSIAEAELGSALSGAPLAKLDVIRAQIADEENQLNHTLEVLNRMTIRSPIAGQISFPMSPDTLLIVYDLDTMVIHLPVVGGAPHNVDWSRGVTVQLGDSSLEVDSNDMLVGNQLFGSGAEQMFIARIRAANGDQMLIPGQRVTARVHGQAKSVLQLVLEMFQG